jgi:hypothetical protein
MNDLQKLTQESEWFMQGMTTPKQVRKVRVARM